MALDEILNERKVREDDRGTAKKAISKMRRELELPNYNAIQEALKEKIYAK